MKQNLNINIIPTANHRERIPAYGHIYHLCAWQAKQRAPVCPTGEQRHISDDRDGHLGKLAE